MEQSLPKIGTDIKMNINLTLPDDLTMAAVDFTAKFTANSSNGQLILKNAMHKVDDNNYIDLSFNNEILSRMILLSVSISVSPGPRIPIPPFCLSR